MKQPTTTPAPAKFLREGSPEWLNYEHAIGQSLLAHSISEGHRGRWVRVDSNGDAIPEKMPGFHLPPKRRGPVGLEEPLTQEARDRAVDRWFNEIRPLITGKPSPTHGTAQTATKGEIEAEHQAQSQAAQRRAERHLAELAEQAKIPVVIGEGLAAKFQAMKNETR